MRDIQDKLQAHIQQSGGRVTKTRKLVLDAAYETVGHFSGDDLYDSLNQQGHAVSRASVYRALALLVEIGLLRESVTDERHKHYECAMGRPHHEHLICRACGRVTEFYDPDLEALLEEIAVRNGFSRSDHRAEIGGLCSQCARESPSVAVR